MEYGILGLQTLVLFVIIWLLKSYFPSYFSEKGKNLATKEDIGKITAEVERIRLEYASELEKTKNHLQAGIEIMRHQLTLQLESSKRHKNTQQQAYVDFITAIAGLAIAQRHKDHDKEIEFLILLTDAKARITVYGSKVVLEKMGGFFERYGVLNTPDAMNAFVDVIQAMREQSVARDELVGTEPISRILYSSPQ